MGFCNPGCRDKFDKATRLFDSTMPALSGQKAAFYRLAEYNEWINSSLFEKAKSLSPDELNRDLGAFFGSVLGTLNHLMVWDVTWLQRFSKHTIPFDSLNPILAYPSPTSHRDILYADLDELRIARKDIDGVLSKFIAETTNAQYLQSFSYSVASGQRFHKNFGGMIQHLFNHQTHHRGQITALLHQLGVDPGVTDLLAMLPDEVL